MVVNVVVQNPQKSNEHEYEKKHVRRDSKMCCCCCCRLCCGAPTTDERIHAHPYSMMHRRLPTTGIEVAPHYHQLLVAILLKYVIFVMLKTSDYARRIASILDATLSLKSAAELHPK